MIDLQWIRSSGPAAAALAAGALAASLWAAATSPALADAPTQPAQEPASTSVPASVVCRIRGEAPGKPDEVLYDARTGGTAIARLTGATVPLQLEHGVPAGGGRVKVATSASRPYLRIEGWADVDAFRLYAANDLPIEGSGGHVSIARGQTLRVTAVLDDRIQVVHRVSGSSHQGVSAQLGCDDATLSVQRPQADVPERARAYQMRHSKLELYNDPNGDVVFTLELDDDVRVLFWSTESRAGWVRIHARTDLAIDAWVRAYEMVPLKHAEVFDPSTAGPRPPRARKLALQDPPPLLVATDELTIHRHPRGDSATFGVVEVGARFYAMEQSGDMTNILPEGIGVLPADTLGFWVKTAELPR